MDQRPEKNSLRMLLALAVHGYTASGMVVAFWIATRIFAQDFRAAFLGMIVAVVIDATDGTLARAVDVRRHTPWLDGRKLDDVVDYVNYTLLPMLLVWRAEWLPAPAELWIAAPLVSSLFAFVHVGAKEESRGFFRGFPSYWNVVVFYLAIARPAPHSWWVTAVVLGLSVLTISPVRFVYPNRPPCWKAFFLGGAVAWALVVGVLAAQFPRVSPLWLAVSLIYPALYTILSLYLDWAGRSRPSQKSDSDDPAPPAFPD